MADDTKNKDRVDLRLYNTIVVFDVYMIARSAEAAREGLLSTITGTIAPTETVAKEVTMPNSIRQSWVNEKPWMALDVTEEEFEQLKGITASEAFTKLYTKGKK
mgnify:CR=1 FL=1